VLIEAAKKTEFVEESPAPFVQQTSLDDFYCRYEINFYTKNIQRIPYVYGKLFENIQDGFNARGVSCTAPHFLNVAASGSVGIAEAA